MTWETELALQNMFLDFVNLSITASWVILAVLILRAVLTRVPKKYVCLLWFVVLFRLLCPVTIETDLSIMPQPSTITYEDVAYTTPQIETNSAVINTVADYTVNPVMKEYLAPNPQGSVNPMQVYLMIATLVWMAGIVALVVYTAISWYKMRLSVRESVPDGGYYRCANISSPFVLGLLKPKIYIPYGLDDEAKEYVLLHEQSHIARKDFLVKPMFWLAVMIHWMNPMVWIAWHYFTRDLELACDERAVDHLTANQKSDYSQTLLNLAVQPKRMHCPVAFGNNSVKQRITHVLHYKGIPALARDIIVILLVVAAVFLAVNPLKAGPLSDFEPKLLEEYPYGLSSVTIQYGIVHVDILDDWVINPDGIHSQKAEAFRDWLANIKVQKINLTESQIPYETGVAINVHGVRDFSIDEVSNMRHYGFDGHGFRISDDLTQIYLGGSYDPIVRVKDEDAFREVILSYCMEELQNYPDTTFYADLNRDGTDEMIIVDPETWESTSQADIAVYKQDGTLLFSDYLYYSHMGWNNYFLYERDGKDYLMEFMPSMYQGVANYSWKLYEFDEKNQLVIAEENKVDFTINPEQYDFNIEPILNFLTEVETMLNDATLLVSVEDGNLLYSTVSEPKTLSIDYYLDWLDTTWTGEKNIGTSLAERLTNYQYSIYYDRPRQDLVQWLIDRKGMDITQQHLEGPELIEIDGVQCVVFDLHWNANTPVLGAFIDRYAISVQDPDDFMDAINGRTYYLYNANDNKWIELENSTDRIATDKLAKYWAETYVNRDGQGRYDMLSKDWQKQIDKLDEYESIGLNWMPYWTENKEALGLRGSSPWVEGWEAFSYVVVDGKKNRHLIRITYDMVDSAQGHYVYEETIELGLEDNEWKVADCYITVDLASREIYNYAQEIVASLQENSYEHAVGNNISGVLQQGADVWRLNPLEVATKFVDDYLLLTDGYWLEFDESKNAVLCHTDVHDYTIYLYQPIHRGEVTDFYAVSGYNYYETDENGKENLRHYHVGEDPWASLHIKPTE